MDSIPQRLCKNCNTSYPLTSEFWHKDSSAAHSLGYMCKSCRLAKNHRNYDENRGVILEQCREYRIENIDKVKTREKNYRQRHKEEKSARDKQYRDANKKKVSKRKQESHLLNREKDNERVKRWKKANPERVRSLNADRRARKLGAEGDGFTVDDRRLQLRSQKGLCWWCGKPMGKDISDDHIVPLVKGGKHDPRNIVLCHLVCNLSKNDSLPQDWVGRLF